MCLLHLSHSSFLLQKTSALFIHSFNSSKSLIYMFTKCSSPITSSRDATCAARVNPSLVFNVLCTLFYLGQMLRVGPLQRTFSEQCNQKKKRPKRTSVNKCIPSPRNRWFRLSLVPVSNLHPYSWAHGGGGAGGSTLAKPDQWSLTDQKANLQLRVQSIEVKRWSGLVWAMSPARESTSSLLKESNGKTPGLRNSLSSVESHSGSNR